MKSRSALIIAAVCLYAVGLCFAATDPAIGTWKLNEAKSKLAPGMGKNDTVVYEAAGDSVKVTIDGTDADGKPSHNEWTGKFDGKDYPVTGDARQDSRSLKQITPQKYQLAVKKGDKVVMTGWIVVAPDGKSRTVTTTGTDAQGKKFKNVAVYDKQ
jgi:hypothetical protein